MDSEIRKVLWNVVMDQIRVMPPRGNVKFKTYLMNKAELIFLSARFDDYFANIDKYYEWESDTEEG